MVWLSCRMQISLAVDGCFVFMGYGRRGARAGQEDERES
jgi:hypothetical protein